MEWGPYFHVTPEVADVLERHGIDPRTPPFLFTNGVAVWMRYGGLMALVVHQTGYCQHLWRNPLEGLQWRCKISTLNLYENEPGRYIGALHVVQPGATYRFGQSSPSRRCWWNRFGGGA